MNIPLRQSTRNTSSFWAAIKVWLTHHWFNDFSLVSLGVGVVIENTSPNQLNQPPYSCESKSDKCKESCWSSSWSFWASTPSILTRLDKQTKAYCCRSPSPQICLLTVVNHVTGLIYTVAGQKLWANLGGSRVSRIKKNFQITSLTGGAAASL